MGEVLSAIIPVFVIAGAAYWVRRANPVDIRTLATLNLYLFVPALVFSSVSKRELEWGVLAQIGLASIVVLAGMTGILTLMGKWRGVDTEHRSAFLLTQFPNLGNFGLPVCLFAFGEPGFAIAIVVMVCGSFLQNSVGIYFAQRTRHPVGKAVFRVLQFPMIYAFVLALACQKLEWPFPTSLTRAIDLTAGAAIPIQLVILGAQLADTSLDTGTNVFLTAGTRLIAGPVLAALVAVCIGMDTLTAKVFITQLAGPVAVGMTTYGAKFDVAPRFLASVVAWSFLLSLVTVATVLFILSHVG